MEIENAVIRGHHDADGITSSYFTSYHLEGRCKIELWDGQFGDSTGLKKGDWMCDMHPTEDFEGTVLDHHGPYTLNHKYKLI